MVYNQVCTGHGKPGKSWNLRISFSRPGKSWNLIVGPWKSWKIKVLFGRSVTADDKTRITHEGELLNSANGMHFGGYAKTGTPVRFWNFRKWQLRIRSWKNEKIVEKDMESHGIWRTQKSRNPVQNGSTFNPLRQKNDQHEISPDNIWNSGQENWGHDQERWI